MHRFMRSVNIHIHIWNIHTLNSLCILGKHVVMHYTDFCGQDHLDKVGKKCTRRKRTYIQAWDPELGLQKRQCSHSTSGSGSLQMKNLGSKHNRGSFGPEATGALGLDIILEAETKPFWLMQKFNIYFGCWYFEYLGMMMESAIIYMEKINGIVKIIRIIEEAIHINRGRKK